MRLILLLFFFIATQTAFTQVTCGGSTAFAILHFTKTNGFDHNTRAVSAQMFSEIGQVENFNINNTNDATIFNDFNVLKTYKVIIFSNTSGDNLLTAQQQQNVTDYIAQGGAFLGIHAATDTYRSRSWSFYNDLVGGIVQSNPNHTAQNYHGTMDVIATHPSTVNVPNPWQKAEEYYYWKMNGGWLSENINPVLRVRSTGNQTYDEARPISWFQTFSSGARSFYTALGHAQSNYTDANNDFRQHLRDALCWCVEAAAPTGLAIEVNEFMVKNTNLGYELSWEVKGNAPTQIEIWRGTTAANLQLIETLRQPLRRGTYLDATATNQAAYYQLKFKNQWNEEELSRVVFAAANQNYLGLNLTYDAETQRLNLWTATSEPIEARFYNSLGQLFLQETIVTQQQIILEQWHRGNYVVQTKFGCQTFVVY